MVFFNQSNYIHYLPFFYNSISIFFSFCLSLCHSTCFYGKKNKNNILLNAFYPLVSLKLSNKVHIPNTKWVLIFRLRLKVICNLFYFLNYLLDFWHKYLPCLHAWQQCKKFTYPIWTTVFLMLFALCVCHLSLNFSICFKHFFN